MGTFRHTYDRKVVLELTPASQPTFARADRPDGRYYYFQLFNNSWIADADVLLKLERLFNGGQPSGWRLTLADGDQVEEYDSNNRLVTIKNRSGLQQTLSYDGQGRLSTVTDHFNRTLSFTYTTGNRVQTMTDPNGQTYIYSYQDDDTILTNGRLVSVTYPGNATRTYHYENTNASLKRALTGITDENNNRRSTWTYSTNSGDFGRAISSVQGPNMSVPANPVNLAYTSATSTSAADAKTTRTFGFETILGVARRTTTSAACNNCGQNAKARTYDPATGFLASETDFNDNKVCYVHDARGLETSRVEGLGSGANCASLPGLSGVQRKISTEWHATFRLMKRIAESKRLTTFVFNGEGVNCGPGGASTPAGLICSKTMQSTTDTNGSQNFSATVTGTPRTWTYTYNAEGQVLTENGPRTDVTDVTTYVYHANAATCTATVTGASTTGCRGQVNTISNALSHVTTISEYNAHGQPLKITDPNGLVIVLAYDVRMRLVSRNVGGEITTYQYWPTGLLEKVTNPDGSFLKHTYDDAHRLIQIEDSITPTPNKIVYTLDAMSNRTKEEIFDQSGTLAQRVEREYNNLNRLTKVKGGTSPTTQVTEYQYDNQGNVTKVTMPFANAGDSIATRSYDQTFDALNRLTTTTEPPKDNNGGTSRGTISHQYDLLDQLTQVTDPRGKITTYTVDGLSNRTQQVSPDTGTTNMTYDAAGNMSSLQDARGFTQTRTYDELNRLLVTAHTGQTISRIYDTNTNSKGRLSNLNDRSGTAGLSYSVQGRLIYKASHIHYVSGGAGHVLVTLPEYDSFGRLSKITYPSGRAVVYSYDAAGRVSGITSNGNTLVSSIKYHPFGSPREWTLGNGQVYTRTFDLDGRVTTYPLSPGVVRTVQYDAGSRITGMTHANSALNHGVGYDNLDRVVSWTQGSSNQAYGYDLSGNRISHTIGANTYTHTISSASNRLISISGPTARTYKHDAAGNRNGDGTYTFTYGTDGRMWGSTENNLASRTNDFGQRMSRVRTGIQPVQSLFVYDEGGRILGEYDEYDTVRLENIYLDDLLLVTIFPNETVIDNTHASAVTVTGTWSTASYGWQTGVDYRYTAAGTGTKTVRWAAPVGTYRVYAHWVHGDDRATNATYVVSHAGGTSNLVRNQQCCGGQWRGFGTFTFAPGGANHVTLSDNANGVVVADAIKFVDVNELSQVKYVYADQINTPRVLRDHSNQEIWNWSNADPFGNQSPSTSGGFTGTFDMRFPGQYVDTSRMFYNYHRYYDPETGRYRGGRVFLDRKAGLLKWMNCSIVAAAMPTFRSSDHEAYTQEPFREAQSPHCVGSPEGRYDAR